MSTKPTNEQAQLHLQVYDLRREARLRQARDWFFKNYIVETLDQAMKLAAPGTETGAFAMMVESRFFGGLDVAETATLLDVSEATVLRDWRAAKAWLAHELRQAQ